MQKYYFIPKEHETLLANAVDLWTSAPNFGWTIITGLYKPNETETAGNSLVKNVLRVDRQIVNIPYSVRNEKNEPQELYAFVLEGDLDLYAPDFKAVLDDIENIKQFEKNTDLLTFIENEKNIID